MAYCIFNLLLGTPPRLAEASLRITADAATSRTSRYLIVAEPAASAALRTETRRSQREAEREPRAASREPRREGAHGRSGQVPAAGSPLRP